MQTAGVKHWLDTQLPPTPSDALPTAAQTQIDALLISQNPMTELIADVMAKNKALNQITDADLKKAAAQVYQQLMNDMAKQAATWQILCDLYSPMQIRERMTWFWSNHFNVHQFKADIRTMAGDYEDKAIRPHALGRFRDLLAATLHHPAMLRYLDNVQNAADHINENYAREIMELHTMGVGSCYTQKNVQELARILTGVGVDTNPDNPHLSPNSKVSSLATDFSNSIRAATTMSTRLSWGMPSRAAVWQRSAKPWISPITRPQRAILHAASRSISSPTSRQNRSSTA